MKSLKDHGFFKTLDVAEQWGKKDKTWLGHGLGQKNKFYQYLREAHPFVFDKRVTMEKRMEGRNYEGVLDLVKDFSIPFSTSLYLMTDSPEISAPFEDGSDRQVFKLYGYLIKEISPERFLVFEVSEIEADRYRDTGYKGVIPMVNVFNIDLKSIEKTLLMMRAIDDGTFDRTPDAHIIKEITCVMNFTKSISVKRVGVEVSRQFNIKSRGIGTGFTSMKYDNIVHIADKEEYEYVRPLDDSTIDWEFRGFWRGHWRAFYVSDLKDQFGRDVVDYTRTGKNRAGVYDVPGYTWVVEHTKGDSRLAEIKTRRVIHE